MAAVLEAGLTRASSERDAEDLRPTGMKQLVRVIVAGLACMGLSSCAGSTGSSGGAGDCVSHYEDVASAATWAGLKDAMVASRAWGRVASIRVQARGVDVGAGDQPAVRVVDLLGTDGLRLVQADVWRTDTGGWRAGAWSQCID